MGCADGSLFVLRLGMGEDEGSGSGGSGGGALSGGGVSGDSGDVVLAVPSASGGEAPAAAGERAF